MITESDEIVRMHIIHVPIQDPLRTPKKPLLNAAKK